MIVNVNTTARLLGVAALTTPLFAQSVEERLNKLERENTTLVAVSPQENISQPCIVDTKSLLSNCV